MIGGVSGNTPIPLQPERSNQNRDQARPSQAEAPRRDTPVQPAFEAQTAEQLENAARARRVAGAGEAEPIRLQSMDQPPASFQNQQALATYSSVEAVGDDEGGELVGLDLRV